MSRHVVHKIILLARGAAENLPKLGGLHEVLVHDGQLLGDGGTGPLLVLLRRLDGLVGHVPVGGWIIRVCAVVTVDGHYAIALIRVESTQRLVDRDLLIVDSKAMAVRVRVGKQTRLQHRVRRGFNAWDHVRR